jgi:hypothetical protein
MTTEMISIAAHHQHATAERHARIGGTTMMKQQHSSTQPNQIPQNVAYRRRLRRVIIEASARFLEQNPQWDEYFFDVNFLLNRGLPIVERHLAGTTSNGAIDLALAWAEEWPTMNASQRKACLQAQTVIASELLHLITEAMVQPVPAIQEERRENGETWRGVGIPLAYVRS